MVSPSCTLVHTLTATTDTCDQHHSLSDDEDDHLQLMHNGTPRHALASSGLSLFSRNERRQRRISPAEVVLRESANDLRASNASAML